MAQIRFGLGAIKGLGEDTVNTILIEREKNGNYLNLSDFAKRLPPKIINKKTLEALAFSGALDSFGDRGSIVASIESLATFAREFHEKKSAGQMGLFGEIQEAVDFQLQESPVDASVILKWERESLGLFVSDHPLSGCMGFLKKFGLPIGHVQPADIGQTRTIHAIVSSVRLITTKRGKNMAILEVEDLSGKIEVACFPMIFDKIPKKALEIDAFIRIEGKFEERDGLTNFIANTIKVGDLAAIKANKEAYASFDQSPKEKAPKNSTNEPYIIQIPETLQKKNIQALKSFIKTKESDTGQKVFLQMKETKVAVPFLVDTSGNFHQQVEKCCTNQNLDF